jgi:hypothetical protein
VRRARFAPRHDGRRDLHRRPMCCCAWRWHRRPARRKSAARSRPSRFGVTADHQNCIMSSHDDCRPRRCRASSRSAKLRHCCGPNAESAERFRCPPCKPTIRIRHVRMHPPRIGGHSFGRGRRRSSAMPPPALLPPVESVNLSSGRFVCREKRTIGARRHYTSLINSSADLLQSVNASGAHVLT